MAKKKKELDATMNDGSGAIMKVHISDVVIIVVITLLCLTCIIPFWHVLVKSISGNSFVQAKAVFLWPKGVTFDAYKSRF